MYIVSLVKIKFKERSLRYAAWLGQSRKADIISDPTVSSHKYQPKLCMQISAFDSFLGPHTNIQVTKNHSFTGNIAQVNCL